MAPLPKRKWSKRRQGKHRAAIKINLGQLNTCPSCSALKRSHQVCPSCGQYNNRQVVVKKTQNKEPKKNQELRT